ncbi:vp91/p95 [Cyclophragma undans nucleopolyhedrovirus]|uniref:Vp91/p95 n=1 Tax=Cyclophragma undans nucleopolyhedrovirus TaxID=1906244 RepID=A0A288QCX9_9ABAC|nr:vp91/p95 [Cyclophragma undans nucleopolyhedrovirus]AOT85473.1 vp91/p95 [Cyclophragma undans nucleopolyhedrovirus]
MSGVLLVMLAIFLIIAFTMVYLSIYFEFDETTFTKRLQTLTEYVRRTNADSPTPDVIGYVSDIFQNTYIVTWFNTLDLSVRHESVHDDRSEIFDFLNQEFRSVERDNFNVRVRPSASNDNEFIVTNDTGDDVTMNCPPHFKFDYAQLKCVAVLPCDAKAPGLYPMNERLLDILIFNQHLNKNYNDIDEPFAQHHHPTLYLRCDSDGGHAVEECPNNYTFDAQIGECALNEMCADKPDGYVLSYFPEALSANQYMKCVDHQQTVASCAHADQIFDRDQMMCVTAANPCFVNGAGHTYITPEIGDAQFLQCLNNFESVLVTCIKRVGDDDSGYECVGDYECTDFANGTGRRVYQHADDYIKYNSGQLICDGYKIVSNIECDQTNVFENALYLNRFKLNLQFPRETFDGVGCVSAGVDDVEFLTSLFPIENLPNHYDIDMQTAVIATVDTIKTLIHNYYGDEDSNFARGLVYARNKNALGLNPVTGEPIECFGDKLYDAFEASRANICAADGQSVVRTLTFSDGEFLNVINANLLGLDDDYKRFCSIHYENNTEIVKNDFFVARILTNILQHDVCAHLYTTIYQKYTTLAPKYTTTPFQYNYTLVKRSKNIEGYVSNTRFANSTISKNKATIMKNDATIPPAFDPFVKNGDVETIAPLFNPFASSKSHYRIALEDDDDRPTQGEPVNEPDRILAETVSSPLILDSKDLFYACHYAVPLFKLTSCHAENDVIVNALQELRNNAQFDIDCEPAKELKHILNAYAYLGNGIGCRSIYDGDSIKVQRESVPSHVYSNLSSQSNDGVKYNRWLHVKNGQYMACPEHLYDNDTFQCAVETNKLYYINNMQEEE